MPRTSGPVEDRRASILQAALAIFAEKGFQRATNRDIAAAVGISPGLIYYYFLNKEDLLFALLERWNREDGDLLSIESDKMLSPEQALLRLSHRVFHRLDHPDARNLLKVVAGEMLRTPQVRALANSHLNTLLEALSRYLAIQMEQRQLCQADPLLCAQTFVSGLMSAILYRQLLGDPRWLLFSADQIITTQVGLFLRGMQPR